MVNYYREMWRLRAHLLAPLTGLTSTKVKFKWGPEQEAAFQEVKRRISTEVLLMYPDFNLPFEIYTDGSKFQLGAVIVQNGRPLANLTAKETARVFDEQWLCRYPRPLHVIHDNGPELTGMEFQEMLSSYGIIAKPITTRNPQANAVLERVHGVVWNCIRAYEMDDPAVFEQPQPFNAICASVSWAINSTVQSATNATPAQLAFNRDMILPIDYQVHWPTILANRKKQMIRDNAKENAKRLDHEFKEGDQVMLKNDEQRRGKFDRRKFGPFTIQEVRSNGTVILNKGTYYETVNTRRIVPFDNG
jgi:hypothetical protein